MTLTINFPLPLSCLDSCKQFFTLNLLSIECILEWLNSQHPSACSRTSFKSYQNPSAIPKPIAADQVFTTQMPLTFMSRSWISSTMTWEIPWRPFSSFLRRTPEGQWNNASKYAVGYCLLTMLTIKIEVKIKTWFHHDKNDILITLDSEWTYQLYRTAWRHGFWEEQYRISQSTPHCYQVFQLFHLLLFLLHSLHWYAWAVT